MNKLSIERLMHTGAALKRTARYVDIVDPKREANALDMLGQKLGKYTLTRLIGKGGTAFVFCAAREEAHYQQEVAVKILDSDLTGSALKDNFFTEAQILAQLNHPNIAKVLDADISPDGLPYIVMELIRGEAIDSYCRSHSLSVNQRLAIILQIVDAVGHAHDHSVVHGDLKPHNILVTGAGAIKLLDFNIASMNKREKNAADEPSGNRLLTPNFAAPEQIRGEAISFRTDVYQLGLIVARILLGLDTQEILVLLRNHSLQDALGGKAIANANADYLRHPRQLGVGDNKVTRALLRDGLMDIIARSLADDPEKRYRNVQRLKTDIEHLVGHRAISSRLGHKTHVVRLFVRRNRSYLLLLVFCIALFVGATAVFIHRLVSEKERALSQQQTATQVTNFLVEMLQESAPKHNPLKKVSLEDILNAGGNKLLTSVDLAAPIRAQLIATICDTYVNLGEFDKTIEFFESSVVRQGLSPEAPHYPPAYLLYVMALSHRGRIEDADRILNRMEQHSAPELDGNYRFWNDFHNRRATIHSQLNRHKAAQQSYERAINIVPAHEVNMLAASKINYAMYLQFIDRAAAAEHYLKAALAPLDINDDGDVSLFVFAYPYLSEALRKQGKLEEAEGIAREGVSLNKKYYSENQHNVAISIGAYAEVMAEKRAFDESVRLYREALEIYTDNYGRDNYMVASLNVAIANVFSRQGDCRSAGLHVTQARTYAERYLAVEDVIFGDIENAMKPCAK